MPDRKPEATLGAKRAREPRTPAEIADATGVTEQRNRALAADAANNVRRTKSRTPGEPDTIEGETIAQMRARVKDERAASEPTEFMKATAAVRDEGLFGGMAGTGTVGTAAARPAAE